MNRMSQLRKGPPSLMAIAAIGLVTACGSGITPAPSTVTVTQPAVVTTTIAAGPTSDPAPSAPVTTSVTAAGPSLNACSDDDLTVTNSGVEPAGTIRRLVVSFTNTSSEPCTLVGYPGADLVTAAGGLMVHAARRPALAAHRLVLAPGGLVVADIEGDTIDASSGNACGREGTVLVTPPNGYVSHLLAAALPVCDTTVSSVD